jgi:hypothetical protein
VIPKKSEQSVQYTCIEKSSLYARKAGVHSTRVEELSLHERVQLLLLPIITSPTRVVGRKGTSPFPDTRANLKPNQGITKEVLNIKHSERESKEKKEKKLTRIVPKKCTYIAAHHQNKQPNKLAAPPQKKKKEKAKNPAVGGSGFAYFESL